MLLTENIVLRVHEWLDRDEKPDLVSRFRKLWKEAPARRHDEAPARPAGALRRRPLFVQPRLGA